MNIKAVTADIIEKNKQLYFYKSFLGNNKTRKTTPKNIKLDGYQKRRKTPGKFGQTDKGQGNRQGELAIDEILI